MNTTRFLTPVWKRQASDFIRELLVAENIALGAIGAETRQLAAQKRQNAADFVRAVPDQLPAPEVKAVSSEVEFRWERRNGEIIEVTLTVRTRTSTVKYSFTGPGEDHSGTINTDKLGKDSILWKLVEMAV